MLLPHFRTRTCIAVHPRRTARSGCSSYRRHRERTFDQLAILVEPKVRLAKVKTIIATNEATVPGCFVAALELEAPRTIW